MNERPAKAKISEKEIKEISKKIFNQNSDLFIDCNVTEVMIFDIINDDRNCNGYYYTRELEENYGAINIGTDLILLLDDVSIELMKKREEMVKKWVKENDIKPKYKIGDEVKYKYGFDDKIGVITDIDYESAIYHMFSIKNSNDLVFYENVTEKL